MIGTLLGAKLGAALAAGAVSFGAVGAAAYTGVLPSGLQRIAHDTISAPAPDPVAEVGDPDKTAVETDPAEVEKDTSADSTQTGTEANKTAVGPDATGSAAFGLCTAWANVEAKGQVAEKSIAFRNLATATGGADKVTGYCATVAHPGTPKTDQSATDPTGTSATHPKGKSADHPTGSSSSHPSGKPQG